MNSRSAARTARHENSISAQLRKNAYILLTYTHLRCQIWDATEKNLEFSSLHKNEWGHRLATSINH